MPDPAPSVRLIAKLSGFSKATVANALNGSETVAPATARKVRAVADKIGYKRNPIVGTLMSAMRRSQGLSLQGVLAVVDIAEPQRPAHGPFHGELIAGAKAQAEEIGFKLETFVIDRSHLSFERLDSILKTRGIRGLVILPSWQTPDFERFDWSWYAGVYTDYITETPRLHSVCCDHYRSMFELLTLLHARGYRRPGLFIEAGRDERIHRRMTAAFRAFQQAHPDVAALAPCATSEIRAEPFARWFKRARPDVVLSHHPEVIAFLEKLGARPPATGFVSLNLAKAQQRCAGLDLQPRQIARCAVELLVSQIQRNAWGHPKCPTTTTLAAQFIDGPTLAFGAAHGSRGMAQR